MLKFIKILKNNKGFTMVELIVAMICFVVFSASVISIVSPMLNNYIHIVNMSDASTLATNIANDIAYDYFEQDATSPRVQPNKGFFLEYDGVNGKQRVGAYVPNTTDMDNSTQGNVVLRNEAPIFDTLFYRRLSVTTNFTLTDGMVTGVIKVFDEDGTQLYTKTFPI